MYIYSPLPIYVYIIYIYLFIYMNICIFHNRIYIFKHTTYYNVYVFWKWNWSNRNFVYNYISASHDVRLKIHLLMGSVLPKRALGYLLFGIYVILRAKAVKTHLQVKVRISLQCKQAFNILKETSSCILEGRNCTVCATWFWTSLILNVSVFRVYFLCLTCIM